MTHFTIYPKGALTRKLAPQTTLLISNHVETKKSEIFWTILGKLPQVPLMLDKYFTANSQITYMTLINQLLGCQVLKNAPLTYVFFIKSGLNPLLTSCPIIHEVATLI